MQSLIYKIRRKIVGSFTSNCIYCSKPAESRKALCSECEALLSKAPMESIFDMDCAFAYNYLSPAKEVLLSYKFSDENRFYLEDALVDWLCDAYEKNFADRDFDYVIPVPVYGKSGSRLSELVKRFAIMENLSFAPALLNKNKETKKQHELSAVERKINLIGAFTAENKVRGKKILLVDDVLTTGSTVRECANALFNEKASAVSVLTIMRTVLE